MGPDQWRLVWIVAYVIIVVPAIDVYSFLASKKISSIDKWARLRDVITVVWATNVSESLTLLYGSCLVWELKNVSWLLAFDLPKYRLVETNRYNHRYCSKSKPVYGSRCPRTCQPPWWTGSSSATSPTTSSPELCPASTSRRQLLWVDPTFYWSNFRISYSPREK